MPTVLQFVKTLASKPEIIVAPSIRLRTYVAREDVGVWLDLRHRAFARLKLGVRQWNLDDFEAEFLSKWWWRPERMWFAEAETPGGGRQAVGTVTLAMRGEASDAQPAIHWLAVLPAWRRRGIGRLLVTALEAHAWEAGHRRIYLETHAAWAAAVELYQRLGYKAVE
jgi:GNAT superfamily N-acetyltransferase